MSVRKFFLKCCYINTHIMTRKIVRYVIMLLLIWLGITYITYEKLSNEDIIVIVLFVMICFIFLDLYYPVVNC